MPSALPAIVRTTCAFAAALAVCWLPSVVAGGQAHLPPLAVALPVLWIGARHGTLAVAAAALAAGIVAGPLTPSDVDAGTAQSASGWLGRTAFLLSFGLLVGWGAHRVRRESAGRAAAEATLSDAAPTLRARTARQAAAARLRRGISDGELELHFQPIAHLDGTGIRGVEALVRWRRPERGLVGPLEFIGLAEQTGVIDALGRWVLRAACRQARAWQDVGLLPNVGVNVSPRELARPGFAEEVVGEIRSWGLDPRRFVVEVTETAWSLEGHRHGPAVAALREAGVLLAIDDFGAGHSSLSRLAELPADIVKIDRAFLRGVPAERRPAAVVAGVLRLVEAFGCDVVAEGVESEGEREFLASHGCPLGQGFGLARPAPAAAITELLARDLLAERRPGVALRQVA